jgi:hypothetical protein
MKIITAILIFSLLTFLFSCSSSKYDVDISSINAARDFSEGFAGFKAGDLWGYMNTTGECVINPQFHETMDFSEKFAAVKLNNKWGFINRNGIFEINPQYDGAKDFCGKLAPVKKDNEWGFINNKGELVIDYQFEDANIFSDDFAAVKLGNKWGFINRDGQYVINPIYSDAGYFCEGLAPVKSEKHENKWGYVDKHGQFVIEPQYDYAQSFNYVNNYTIPVLAAIMIDDDWGFIDTKGKNVINPQYEDALPFSEGVAPVKSGGKWGFIDNNNRQKISFTYDNAGCIQNGYSLISKDGIGYFIDNKGKDAELISIAAGTESHEFGKFKPPDKRLEGLISQKKLFINFYNFCSDTVELHTFDMKSEDSVLYEGIKIPPQMFFRPEQGIKNYDGFISIYIAKHHYCNIWLFTHHVGGPHESMTLIPVPAQDISFGNDYYTNTGRAPYSALYYTANKKYNIYLQGYDGRTIDNDYWKRPVPCWGNFSVLIENIDTRAVPEY